MAANTGATTNLAKDDTPLANEQPTPNGISVTTASNDTIIGTSKGYLPINTNPKAATCHQVPNIHTPLLSVGQLCNENCTAVFTKDKVTIAKENNIDVKPNKSSYD